MRTLHARGAGLLAKESLSSICCKVRGARGLRPFRHTVAPDCVYPIILERDLRHLLSIVIHPHALKSKAVITQQRARSSGSQISTFAKSRTWSTSGCADFGGASPWLQAKTDIENTANTGFLSLVLAKFSECARGAKRWM